MTGNPGTLLLTAGIFILGSSKMPMWISIILAIPLAILMCITISIEIIVVKIFFKYEAEFINSNDTEEFRENKRKWLDEHIGNKNYITTGFSQNKKKRKKVLKISMLY